MKIALCDDEQTAIDLLIEYVNRYLTHNNLKATIDTYSCGEDFLEACNKITYDVVFLDIYMKQLNGMETALRLKKTQTTKLIFVTTSKEFALEAFSVSAIHYLLKPVTYEAVETALDRCALCMNRIPNLIVKSNLMQIPIPEDNIIFIEIIQKVCYIHTKNHKNPITTRQTIQSIAGSLKSPFFMQPHRSYIINMNYIDSLLMRDIILVTKDIIPFSRNLRERCIQQYENFLLGLSQEV